MTLDDFLNHIEAGGALITAESLCIWMGLPMSPARPVR